MNVCLPADKLGAPVPTGMKGTHTIRGQDPTQQPLKNLVRQNLHAVFSGAEHMPSTPGPSGHSDRNVQASEPSRAISVAGSTAPGAH